MIEAPQGKRFTPVTSSLRWQSLKRLACGCQGDYISAASDSSSLRLQQAKVKDVDPLEAMQVGRHVLYYNPKARRFESRVVKIDEQLSFLFVLQEGTLKEPFAARLYEVDEDYESKMPITHMISFPIEYASVKIEINKLLDRLGILPALDLTRLSLVMYEMVIHRHWIHPHMKLFPGGMYEFMHDRNGLHAHFNVSAEVQSQLLEVPQPPRRQMDVHFYSSKAMQATTLALKHLLSLETVFQAADKRKVSESPEDVTQGVQIFCRSSRRPDEEDLSQIDEESCSDEELSETWKEPCRRSSGGVVLDVSTEPPEFEDVSDVEDFAFAVRREI